MAHCVFPVIMYYIDTEKYSPKSNVVNFRTQISCSQSEERTMVFTREKNDTSNQNRERCFFTCEKNDTSNQKPQRCVSFAPKFPLRTHSTRKVLLKEFFSLKKWKTFRKWSGIVSFVSLSIKKTVESRRNNSGKGKTERDVSFCFAFCRSHFAFHLSLLKLILKPAILLKFNHWEQTLKITYSSWITSYPYRHLCF